MVTCCIYAKGLSTLPLFTEIAGEKCFDFAKLIPATEEDDLVEKWGSSTNANESELTKYSSVLFTVDSVPMPVFDELGKRYGSDIPVVCAWATSDGGAYMRDYTNNLNPETKTIRKEQKHV